MPQYKMEFQFSKATEVWSNQFYTHADSYPEVETMALAIAGVFKNNMATSITVERVLVYPLPFTKNIFQTITIGEAGTAPFADTPPLFNVARWRLATGIGRADQHYIRGTFPTSAIGTGGMFTPSALTDQQAILTTLLDLTQPLVNIHNFQYAYGSVAPQIGMRQLRKASKKKPKPA